MDHLRIYIETAFSRSLRLLLDQPEIPDFSRIPKEQFLTVARECAPSLSDDALRLIHRLAGHDWNHSATEDPGDLPLPKASAVFRSVFDAAERLLINDGNELRVRFQNLFKWRDMTRPVGEDLFVTAYLAAEDAHAFRQSPDIGRRLCFPPTLHNDNPDIGWIMENERLHELHTHLFASANVFNINWVCLMNKPSGRHKDLLGFIKILEDIPDDKKALRMQEFLVKAAWFRYEAWRLLNGVADRSDFSNLISVLSRPHGEKEGRRLQTTVNALMAGGPDCPDYIQPQGVPAHAAGDFRVYLGERYFLYLSFLYILRTEDALFVSWFRFYLLVKALIRNYMIQLNKNHGFANFKRYQDVKGLFVKKHPLYARLLGSLAVPDAWRDSNIAYQEVRIAPEKSWKLGYRNVNGIIHSIDSELDTMEQAGDDNKKLSERPDYGIIYHFIKLKENPADPLTASALKPRNHNVRKDLRRQSHIIRRLFHIERLRIKAIDAAASEFNCRPEAFGQAFRFLKHAGMGITFHAGEDYYDIADGLRAIDEAVTFLGMTGGDRIGHAIAMGIDPHAFYRRCERHVIVPAQWMLDNVVWLLFRSADWNIRLEPATEAFLRSQFHDLYSNIYHTGNPEDDSIDEKEYFDSLLLRSDLPEWYVGAGKERAGEPEFSDSWNNFRLLHSRKADLARSNGRIKRLFRRYYFDPLVRKKGERVIEFKVCEGYARLIEEMQHRMMRRLERKHIIIECCPSSNLLIGSLERFRNHPAFRFYEVSRQHNHHLKITLNTDDLGVFQTSLANEYSFMALALAKERNTDGNPVYMPHQINRWLTDIARNGAKSRF